MLLSSSSSGLSFRVLLCLKHTTVNTAKITSTMRTRDIGSNVANNVKVLVELTGEVGLGTGLVTEVSGIRK